MYRSIDSTVILRDVRRETLQALTARRSLVKSGLAATKHSASDFGPDYEGSQIRGRCAAGGTHKSLHDPYQAWANMGERIPER